MLNKGMLRNTIVPGCTLKKHFWQEFDQSCKSTWCLPGTARQTYGNWQSWKRIEQGQDRQVGQSSSLLPSDGVNLEQDQIYQNKERASPSACCLTFHLFLGCVHTLYWNSQSQDVGAGTHWLWGHVPTPLKSSVVSNRSLTAKSYLRNICIFYI